MNWTDWKYLIIATALALATATLPFASWFPVPASAVVVPPAPAPPKWQMSKQPTSTAVQAFLGTMTANQSGAAKVAIGGDFYYVWYPEK